MKAQPLSSAQAHRFATSRLAAHHAQWIAHSLRASCGSAFASRRSLAFPFFGPWGVRSGSRRSVSGAGSALLAILHRGAALALVPLLLASCAVRFVAPYDEVFDRQVSDFYQKTAVFLAKMDTTRGPYESNRAFYSEAAGTIEVLRTRASLYDEAKNRGTLKEIGDLEQAFADLQDMHRAGPLVGDGYRAMRNTLSMHFRALLQIELHKKHSLAVTKPS